jgi:hypothetical protein
MLFQIVWEQPLCGDHHLPARLKALNDKTHVIGSQAALPDVVIGFPGDQTNEKSWHPVRDAID